MSQNHNTPQVLDAACVFLCPINMEAEGLASIAPLERSWQTKGTQYDVSDVDFQAARYASAFHDAGRRGNTT